MASLVFSIPHWMAWSPSAKSRGGNWAPPDAPTILKRRVSPLGREALLAAFGLPDVGASRFVLSSRHGEFGRTQALLSALADGEPLSPADFSLSVHHGLIGLLSIATGNRLGHTAVAAGRESFAYGLLEAAAAATERPGQPMALVHFDEPLPPPWDAVDGAQEAPLAMALYLTSPAGGRNDVTFDWAPKKERAPVCDSLALEFLSFLQGDIRAGGAIGERMEWRWGRADGAS